MACPQNKVSKARKNKRRAHHARSAVSLARCKRCGGPTPPHVVCANCGHYRGKPVLNLED